MTLAAINCCDKVFTGQASSDIVQEKFPHPCDCPTISIQAEVLFYGTEMIGWFEGSDPDEGINRSLPPKRFRRCTIVGSGTDSSNSFDCDGVPYTPNSSTASGTKICDVEDDESITTSGSLTVTTTTYECIDNVVEGPNVTDTDATPNCPGYSISFAPEFSFGWVSNTEYQNTLLGNNLLLATFTLSDEDTDLTAEKRAFFVNPESVTDDRNDPVWSDPTNPAWKAPVPGAIGISSFWIVRTSSGTTNTFFPRQFSFYNFRCNNIIVGLEYKISYSIKRRTITRGVSGTGPFGGSLPGVWVGDWEAVSNEELIFTATADEEVIEGSDYLGAYFALQNVRGYEYAIWNLTLELN